MQRIDIIREHFFNREQIYSYLQEHYHVDTNATVISGITQWDDKDFDFLLQVSRRHGIPNTFSRDLYLALNNINLIDAKKLKIIQILYHSIKFIPKINYFQTFKLLHEVIASNTKTADRFSNQTKNSLIQLCNIFIEKYEKSQNSLQYSEVHKRNVLQLLHDLQGAIEVFNCKSSSSASSSSASSSSSAAGKSSSVITSEKFLLSQFRDSSSSASVGGKRKKLNLQMELTKQLHATKVLIKSSQTEEETLSIQTLVQSAKESQKQINSKEISKQKKPTTQSGSDRGYLETHYQAVTKLYSKASKGELLKEDDITYLIRIFLKRDEKPLVDICTNFFIDRVISKVFLKFLKKQYNANELVRDKLFLGLQSMKDLKKMIFITATNENIINEMIDIFMKFNCYQTDEAVRSIAEPILKACKFYDGYLTYYLYSPEKVDSNAILLIIEKELEEIRKECMLAIYNAVIRDKTFLDESKLNILKSIMINENEQNKFVQKFAMKSIALIDQATLKDTSYPTIFTNFLADIDSFSKKEGSTTETISEGIVDNDHISQGLHYIHSQLQYEERCNNLFPKQEAKVEFITKIISFLKSLKLEKDQKATCYEILIECLRFMKLSFQEAHFLDLLSIFKQEMTSIADFHYLILQFIIHYIEQMNTNDHPHQCNDLIVYRLNEIFLLADSKDYLQYLIVFIFYTITNKKCVDYNFISKMLFAQSMVNMSPDGIVEFIVAEDELDAENINESSGFSIARMAARIIFESITMHQAVDIHLMKPRTIQRLVDSLSHPDPAVAMYCVKTLYFLTDHLHLRFHWDNSIFFSLQKFCQKSEDYSNSVDDLKKLEFILYFKSCYLKQFTFSLLEERITSLEILNSLPFIYLLDEQQIIDEINFTHQINTEILCIFQRYLLRQVTLPDSIFPLFLQFARDKNQISFIEDELLSFEQLWLELLAQIIQNQQTLPSIVIDVLENYLFDEKKQDLILKKFLIPLILHNLQIINCSTTLEFFQFILLSSESKEMRENIYQCLLALECRMELPDDCFQVMEIERASHYLQNHAETDGNIIEESKNAWNLLVQLVSEGQSLTMTFWDYIETRSFSLQILQLLKVHISNGFSVPSKIMNAVIRQLHLNVDSQSIFSFSLFRHLYLRNTERVEDHHPIELLEILYLLERNNQSLPQTIMSQLMTYLLSKSGGHSDFLLSFIILLIYLCKYQRGECIPMVIIEKIVDFLIPITDKRRSMAEINSKENRNGQVIPQEQDHHCLSSLMNELDFIRSCFFLISQEIDSLYQESARRQKIDSLFLNLISFFSEDSVISEKILYCIKHLKAQNNFSSNLISQMLALIQDPSLIINQHMKVNLLSLFESSHNANEQEYLLRSYFQYESDPILFTKELHKLFVGDRTLSDEREEISDNQRGILLSQIWKMQDILKSHEDLQFKLIEVLYHSGCIGSFPSDFIHTLTILKDSTTNSIMAATIEELLFTYPEREETSEKIDPASFIDNSFSLGINLQLIRSRRYHLLLPQLDQLSSLLDEFTMKTGLRLVPDEDVELIHTISSVKIIRFPPRTTIARIDLHKAMILSDWCSSWKIDNLADEWNLFLRVTAFQEAFLTQSHLSAEKFILLFKLLHARKDISANGINIGFILTFLPIILFKPGYTDGYDDLLQVLCNHSKEFSAIRFLWITRLFTENEKIQTDSTILTFLINEIISMFPPPLGEQLTDSIVGTMIRDVKSVRRCLELLKYFHEKLQLPYEQLIDQISGIISVQSKLTLLFFEDILIFFQTDIVMAIIYSQFIENNDKEHHYDQNNTISLEGLRSENEKHRLQILLQQFLVQNDSWRVEDLFTLLSNNEKEVDSSSHCWIEMKNVYGIQDLLYAIVQYSLPCTASIINELKEIMKSSMDQKQWLHEMNQKIILKQFSMNGNHKTPRELLEDYENENLNHGVYGDTKRLLSLMNAIITHRSEYLTWKDEDFLNWKTNLSKNYFEKEENTSIRQCISIIERAYYTLSGNHFTNTQLLACLTALITEPAKLGKERMPRGLLLQVLTGEGKTVVITTLAIVKVLQGHVVDIITSSPVEAERCSREQSLLYQKFKISVSNNVDRSRYISGPKDCYYSQVVYGEISQFQFDYLRDEYSLLGTKCKRAYDYFIGDEIDSILIDESRRIAKLSSPIAGMDQFQSIYIYLFYQLKELLKRICLIDQSFYFFYGSLTYHPNDNNRISLIFHQSSPSSPSPASSHSRSASSLPGTELNLHEIHDIKVFIQENQQKGLENILNQIGFKIDSEIDFFLKDKLNSYLNELIDQKVITIPFYLQEYFNEMKDIWIQNQIISFLQLHENAHYLVIDSMIKPVNYDSNGVIQHATQWSHGIHQGLQLKHQLSLTSETITTNFISTMAYVKKYGTNIIGLTGTLGSMKAKQSMEEIYSMKCILIPCSRKKQFHYIPPWIATASSSLSSSSSSPSSITNAKGQWLQDIQFEVFQELKKSRGILIICQLIEEVKLIEQYLIDHLPLHSYHSLKTYTMNNMNQEKEISKIFPKEIIISTLLGGRGMDIKAEEINQFGGLHVILTFLPNDQRNQEQALSRTARQGKLGSGKLILNEQQLFNDSSLQYQSHTAVPWYSSQTRHIQLTSLQERKDLQFFQDQLKNELIIIDMKDKLFQFFCSFVKEIREEIRSKRTNWQRIKDFSSSLIGSSAAITVEETIIINAMEERWARFLRKIDKLSSSSSSDSVSSKSSLSEVVESLMNKFLGQLKTDYEQNTLIENPFHLIALGNDLLYSYAKSATIPITKVNIIHSYYLKSIQQSQDTVPAAYIGLAWWTLKTKCHWKLPFDEKTNPINLSQYKTFAREAIQKAILLLQNEMSQLLSLQTILIECGHLPDSAGMKQMLTRINLIGMLIQNMQNNDLYIQQSQRLVTVEHSCHYVLANSSLTPSIPIPSSSMSSSSSSTKASFSSTLIETNIYSNMNRFSVANHIWKTFTKPTRENELSRRQRFELTFHDLKAFQDITVDDQAVEFINAIYSPSLLSSAISRKFAGQLSISCSNTSFSIYDQLSNQITHLNLVKSKAMALLKQMKTDSNSIWKLNLSNELETKVYLKIVSKQNPNKSLIEWAEISLEGAYDKVFHQINHIKDPLISIRCITTNQKPFNSFDLIIHKPMNDEIDAIRSMNESNSIQTEFNGSLIEIQKFLNIIDSLLIPTIIIESLHPVNENGNAFYTQQKAFTLRNDKKNGIAIGELWKERTSYFQLLQNTFKISHVTAILCDLNKSMLFNLVKELKTHYPSMTIFPPPSSGVSFEGAETPAPTPSCLINFDKLSLKGIQNDSFWSISSVFNQCNRKSFDFKFYSIDSTNTIAIITQLRNKQIEFLLHVENIPSTEQLNEVISIAKQKIKEESMIIDSIKTLNEVYAFQEEIVSEIKDLEERGLQFQLHFQEQSSIPWRSSIALTLIGGVQIGVGGALITTGFGANLGMSLITEGAADIFWSTRNLSIRQFDWTEYTKQKGISLAISACTLGWGKIKDGGKAMNTLLTGVTQEALEQAGTKAIMNSSTLGQLLSKYSSKLQSTAMREIGITLVEGAGREVLNQCMDSMVNISFQHYQEQISNVIESRTKTKFLLNSPLQVLTLNALAIDRLSQLQRDQSTPTTTNTNSNNRQKQQHPLQDYLKNLVREILSSQSLSSWKTIGYSLFRGVLGTSSNYGKSITTAARVTEALTGMTEITIMIDRFHHTFYERLIAMNQETISFSKILELYCPTCPTAMDILLNHQIIYPQDIGNGGIYYFMDDRRLANIQESYPDLYAFCSKQWLIARGQSDVQIISSFIIQEISSKIIDVAEKQLISPVTTYLASAAVSSLSRTIQDAILRQEIEQEQKKLSKEIDELEKKQQEHEQDDGKNNNTSNVLTAEEKNRYNGLVTEYAKNAATLMKHPRLSNQQMILDAARDYTITYQQCMQIYAASQSSSNNNHKGAQGSDVLSSKVPKIVEDHVKKLTDEQAPAGLMEIVTMLKDNGIENYKIVSENYQPTKEDQGIHLITFQEGMPDPSSSTGREGLGHWTLKNADGSLQDIPSGEKDCGFAVIGQLTGKNVQQLRMETALSIIDSSSSSSSTASPTVSSFLSWLTPSSSSTSSTPSFAAGLEARQWIETRYSHEANSLNMIGAGNVFFSYEWGNQEKVKAFYKVFRHLLPKENDIWFDIYKNRDNMGAAIAAGINTSDHAIIFVDRAYVMKVNNSMNIDGFIPREFEAFAEHAAGKYGRKENGFDRIYVVLENIHDLPYGQFQLYMKNTMYYDLSNVNIHSKQFHQTIQKMFHDYPQLKESSKRMNYLYEQQQQQQQKLPIPMKNTTDLTDSIDSSPPPSPSIANHFMKIGNELIEVFSILIGKSFQPFV